MRLTKTAAALVVLALGAVAAESALAAGHGGRGGFHHGGGFRGGARVGVFIGAPLFWPSYYYGSQYYYGYPYYYGAPYYYPPVAAAAPPVYVEQAQARPAPAQPQGFWYYCASAGAYYPYVKQCAENWQQVAPQPPY